MRGLAQVVRPAERSAEPGGGGGGGGGAAAPVAINDAALTELCRKLDLSRDEVGGLPWSNNKL